MYLWQFIIDKLTDIVMNILIIVFFLHIRNPNTDGKGGYAEKSWPAYTKKEDNVMYLSAKEITNNKFKTRQKYCQALSAITPYLCKLTLFIAPEEAIGEF